MLDVPQSQPTDDNLADDPGTHAPRVEDLAVSSEASSAKSLLESVPTGDHEQPEMAITGEDWSSDDIERAYLKALHAVEDMPWSNASEGQPDEEDASVEAVPTAGPPSESTGETPPAEPMQAVDATQAPSPPPESAGSPTPAPGPRLARGTERNRAVSEEDPPNVTPRQVLEAALFVGGTPLSAKKLCTLLRGSFDAAMVEQLIDELNTGYSTESRPYEIRMGQGGYRLELKPEYERLRQRVYGAGPREVKLSQDVLEVLALVAYQQPITQQQIESHGKQNAGNLLRQLLRRELISIHRGEGGRKDVKYHTTSRFLSLFGLGSLDELPRAEDIDVK